MYCKTYFYSWVCYFDYQTSILPRFHLKSGFYLHQFVWSYFFLVCACHKWHQQLYQVAIKFGHLFVHQNEDCVYESVIIVHFEWIDSRHRNERTLKGTKATTNGSNKLNNIIIIIISECDCGMKQKIILWKSATTIHFILSVKDIWKQARTHTQNWVTIIFIYVHFFVVVVVIIYLWISVDNKCTSQQSAAVIICLKTRCGVELLVQTTILLFKLNFVYLQRLAWLRCEFIDGFPFICFLLLQWWRGISSQNCPVTHFLQFLAL